MRNVFPLLLAFSFIAACSSKTNCPGEDGNIAASGQNLFIKRVSFYSNDSVIAATYFCADTNWTELAKALWHEKTKLLAGKDSSTVYYLIVFNEFDKTPDIAKNLDIAWNYEYMHYRSCVIDNGFGFVRFCYGLRYDEGRVGDWANFRAVNDDGTLAEEQ